MRARFSFPILTFNCHSQLCLIKSFGFAIKILHSMINQYIHVFCLSSFSAIVEVYEVDVIHGFHKHKAEATLFFFYRKKQHHKITSDGLWLKNHSSTSGIIMQSCKSCKALINGSWSHLEVPLQLYQNFFHCVNTKKQHKKGKKDCQSAFHLSVTDFYKKFFFWFSSTN